MRSEGASPFDSASGEKARAQTLHPRATTKDEPQASVITLFHQRRDLARAFLETAARLAEAHINIEWLFGDSNSSDGTAQDVAQSEFFARHLLFDENVGFARGNNALAEQARGRILVFLNYDVCLAPRWLDEIVAQFADRSRLGIVGNIQLSVRTRGIDHAGVFFSRDGAPRHYRPSRGALDHLGLFPTPAVTGACMAIRRELFESLGGFDEGYVNGYEDIDLCVRAREAGYDIGVATKSVIWHYICSSPGRHTAEDANAARFERQCGEQARTLAAYRPPQLSESSASTPFASILDAHETLQVFHPSSEGYSEQNSSFHLLRCGRWSRVCIPLASRSLAPDSDATWRLDPGVAPGQITLAGLALRKGPEQTLLWQARGTELSAICSVEGTGQRVDNQRALVINNNGNDPQIVITLPSALVTNSPETSLSAWMRIDPLPAAPVPAADKPKILTLRRRRIVADLTRLQPGGLNGGVKVFVLNLLAALARRDRLTASVTAITAPSLFEELSPTRPPYRLISSASSSPDPDRVVRTADVLYTPLGFSQFTRPGLPQVSLVVDLLHRDLPEMLPLAETAFRERWMVETIASSRFIQCNSHFVAERLGMHYGVDPKRVVVVYNSIGKRLSRRKFHARRSRTPQTGAYFIYPANDWPHKNHFRLLQAFACHQQRATRPWKLHLTGHFNQPEALASHIRELGLERNVIMHGFLDEAAFGRLFQDAGALVFPSLYEGFGIPLVEAFSAGLPVTCSRCGSLPEVGGDACHYFDSLDVKDIARALDLVSSDSGLRGRLRAAGKERSTAFRFSREVARLSETLRKAAVA